MCGNNESSTIRTFKYLSSYIFLNRASDNRGNERERERERANKGYIE